MLLAHAPPDEQEAIFRLLVPVRYTAKTIKTPKLLRAALKKIVADGYAYSDQEREEGVRAVGSADLQPRRGTLLRDDERSNVSVHRG